MSQNQQSLTLRQKWETWSLVRRRKNARGLHELRACFRDWEFARRLPPRLHARFWISCPSCSLLHGMDDLHHGFHFAHWSTLSETCIMCDIIRQCFKIVTEDVQHSQFSCRFVWTDIAAHMPSPAVQLCYKNRERLHQHVQLFSKGELSSHNPFSSSLEILRNPRSSELLGKLKSWLSNCDTHLECVPVEGDFVPTRLIRITEDADDYDIRLSSPTDRVRYAALTYCWGSSEQPTTTKANLFARSTGLRSSILPKTLQDAIFITKSLGLKHIWIDSICIVQDDKNEWAVQASKMATIYSNAYIVLAATSAKNSSDGFLQLRRMPSKISSYDKWGGIVEIEAMLNDSHDCYLDGDSSDFPLFKRAWCLQERLMARRVIHFLPQEILFVCRKERQCECNSLADRTRSLGTTLGGYAFGKLLALAESEDENSTSFDYNFGMLWANIVEEYSSLILTHPEDVLPALSGIAASLARLNTGPYIEGLWTRDIAYQLGWSPKEYPSGRQCAVPSLKDQPHRPTFSWTSWQYGVDFARVSNKEESLCTFLSTDIRPATENPYGPSLRGSIHLDGKIAPGLDFKQYFHLKSPSKYIQLDLDVAFGLEPAREEALPWERIMILGLIHDPILNRLSALLLQRCEEGPEYARIGLVEYLESSWFFEHAVDDTVAII